jgi:hypothetical protein
VFRKFSAIAAVVVGLLLVSASAVTAAVPTGSAANQASSWVTHLANDKGITAQCFKHEADAETSHGYVDGKAVVLNTFNQAWFGDHWALLVVKGGQNGRTVVYNPTAGVEYFAPDNDNGRPADVSHWIVCKGETPPPPPEDPNLVVSGEVSCLNGAPLITWSIESDFELLVTYTLTPSDGATGELLAPATLFTPVIAGQTYTLTVDEVEASVEVEAGLCFVTPPTTIPPTPPTTVPPTTVPPVVTPEPPVVVTEEPPVLTPQPEVLAFTGAHTAPFVVLGTLLFLGGIASLLIRRRIAA